jgi:hypothetical protein
LLERGCPPLLRDAPQGTDLLFRRWNQSHTALLFTKTMEEHHDFQMSCNSIPGYRVDDRRGGGANSHKPSGFDNQCYYAQGG